MEKKIYKKGSFGVRLCAYIIDLLILIMLSMIIRTFLPPFQLLERLTDLLLPPLYGALFLWLKGATPGKMMFKIKVLDETYKPIGFWRALMRETVGKLISGIIFGLGYSWMLIDKKNQTWHDKIANTFVVRTNKIDSLKQVTSNEAITLKRRLSFILLVLSSVLPVLFLITYFFLFRPFQISGDAMYPNFISGQYYLTQIAPRSLKRGDVIIFKSPTNPEVDLIKRIIALPGETVTLNNGDVYVNNQKINESQYLDLDIKTSSGTFLNEGKSLTVPKNAYFVLGDNRPYSTDSREWGFVPFKMVISKTIFCYWNCN